MDAPATQPYALDFNCPIHCTTTQEATLSKDYPLHTTEQEVWSEFVIRRYLESLWLPDSLINLTLLVSSLRLVPSYCVSSCIFPLLKSARETQNKYHQELPKVLADQGGNGDIEEAMMWYGWSHEKYAAPEGTDAEEHERQWKNRWLDKLEKRETQIQVLLHLMVLSSPTPSNGFAFPMSSPSKSSSAPSSSPTKRKKTDIYEEEREPSLEDKLVYLMDKLGCWSLFESLDIPGGPGVTADRNWTQVYCEDIVERHFNDKLPKLCALLREKVFPEDTMPDSPDLGPSRPQMRRSLSRQFSREPSIPPLSLSREPSLSRLHSREPSVPPLPLTGRERSRSVSVAQDDGRGKSQTRKDINVQNSYVVNFRRSLSKPTGKLDLKNGKESQSQKPPPPQKKRTFDQSLSQGNTLVFETPPKVVKDTLKPKTFLFHPIEEEELHRMKEEDHSGDDAMFAAETPIKAKKRKT